MSAPPCDWCDDPATAALPDLTADMGGGWIGAPSHPRPSYACGSHEAMWGEGRVASIEERQQ